jgi:hypothetical protein
MSAPHPNQLHLQKKTNPQTNPVTFADTLDLTGQLAQNKRIIIGFNGGRQTGTRNDSSLDHPPDGGGAQT